MRKKRESYISYDKEAFLDQKTGAVQRLDNTAWYLKKKITNDGEVGFFLNMHTKFQQIKFWNAAKVISLCNRCQSSKCSKV